jgi:hypothetical protein
MFIADTLVTRPLPEAADTADWAGFAWLMGIPKDYREHFISWLRRSIRGTWWLMVDVERECRRMAALEAHGVPAKAKGRRRGSSYAADIAKAGRAFMRALEARDALSDRKMAKAVARHLQNVKAPKRGAPKRDDRFADFLEKLIIVACGFGGSITFNRKTGKGNVVDLVNELRPLMPEGFIPNVLPKSTIERLAAKARSSMSAPGMVESMPRVFMQLGEILSRHTAEDEHERVSVALIHEELQAEELRAPRRRCSASSIVAGERTPHRPAPHLVPAGRISRDLNT